MQPVLLVGKGPTVRRVSGSPDVAVAALNGAIRLCERAEFLFVNDISAFREIDSEALARVGRIVLPAELHCDTAGRQRMRWSEAVERFNLSLPIELFELHTNACRDCGLPYFGRVLSVGESAVAWLLAAGHREFQTLGIDPDGGYSRHFAGGPQVPKPAAHFRENWRRICRRVRAAGGTIERLGIGV